MGVVLQAGTVASLTALEVSCLETEHHERRVPALDLLAADMVVAMPATDAVVGIYQGVSHFVACQPEAGSIVAEVLVERSWTVFLGKAQTAVVLGESGSDMMAD